MIGLLENERAKPVRQKHKPHRIYSRTIANHKERMAVRRAEQLIRKVTRRFNDTSKLYAPNGKRECARRLARLSA